MNWLGGIPWQLWAGVAVIAAPPLAYCTGYDAGEREGREAVKAELRKAERKAVRDAWRARANADAKAQERAKAQQDILRGQLESIEQAEADDENPLDSLF